MVDQAIEYINAAIDLFRRKNLPVICIQHIEPNLKPGMKGFDLPEKLQILESDLHIHKTYGNAFNKTPLLTKLQELDVDTVIVTGYQAEGCVLSTCRGAKDVDIFPIILRDSIISEDPQNARFVEKIHSLVTLGALENFLE